MATFESSNRRLPEAKRWKVRLYPRGLHVAPGLGEHGFWVSRELFLDRGELALGAINALQVPLQKKTIIPVDAAARRELRRWLEPDQGRLLARTIRKQRYWLLFIAVVWIWGALPTAKHALDMLGMVSGVLALVTALAGIFRPVRPVLIGEGAWVILWVVTLVLKLADGGSAWLVVLLLLAFAWMANVIGQFRFYAPLPPDPPVI
jgi:hypothetical protein